MEYLGLQRLGARNLDIVTRGLLSRRLFRQVPRKTDLLTRLPFLQMLHDHSFPSYRAIRVVIMSPLPNQSFRHNLHRSRCCRSRHVPMISHQSLIPYSQITSPPPSRCINRCLPISILSNSSDLPPIWVSKVCEDPSPERAYASRWLRNFHLLLSISPHA